LCGIANDGVPSYIGLLDGAVARVPESNQNPSSTGRRAVDARVIGVCWSGYIEEFVPGFTDHHLGGLAGRGGGWRGLLLFVFELRECREGR